MDRFAEKNRTGASAIIVVMMFAVTILFAFFSINIANIQRHQASSQVAVDLAARWGSDMLARETNRGVVRRQVNDLVARNWMPKQALNPGWLRKSKRNIDIDIKIGSVNLSEKGKFYENRRPVNSVQVGGFSTMRLVGPGNSKSEPIGISRAATAATLERDICLVVDRSGSMNSDLDTGGNIYDNSFHKENPLSRSLDYTWRSISYEWWWYWPHPTNSRWSAMIDAVYRLADELERTQQKERFSIVSYSTGFEASLYTHGDDVSFKFYTADASSVESFPTRKYMTAVKRLENRYRSQQPVYGGTNIAAGIDKAVEVLTGPRARPNAFKTIIVMTDGIYNDGRPPWLAANEAAAAGIEVYTVTFSRHADQQAMMRTADMGRGLHFHANDGTSLAEIFEKIANLPTKVFIE